MKFINFQWSNVVSSLFIRIIQSADLEEIVNYEKQKLVEQFPDEMEREIHSWNTRWRKESLEHYLPKGWSFLARDPSQRSEHSPEGLLVGYFLGQPLLFFDGQTQSLWVEHLQHSTLQARDELCELAYRLSREKHFQRVFLPQHQSIQNAVRAFKPTEWDPEVMMIKTTKA
jgi:hypothetical protein